MAFWVKIEGVTLPGHNDDPGEGASGYIVRRRESLTPQPGFLSAFPILPVIEPPGARGQGRFGLSY